ncbi:MAG TPA: ISAzo13 family transposase, partial [Baekduia sp.]|nr:ISAzo13 family transposase [Baekduia sp.]
MERGAEKKVAARWRLFEPECDERRRRLWAAAEARTHGSGGVALVARATGISQETIRRGLAELDSDERLEPGRVRRPGGGRKPISETDPRALEDLERLVDPATRGDPESPLRWTTKSTRHLARELTAMGTAISHTAVAAILRATGYSLQGTRK